MTKQFNIISVKQHIYAGKNFSGMVTHNNLDIVVNFDNHAHSIEACRGYFDSNMKRVSIKFALEPSLANGRELSEIANYLHESGQGMLHESLSADGFPVQFDAKEYVSTLSVTAYGREYYVLLDSDIAKKTVEASGIKSLIGLSNRQIIDKIIV